eukprot:4073468-Prymnesium_polylepis.1
MITSRIRMAQTVKLVLCTAALTLICTSTYSMRYNLGIADACAKPCNFLSASSCTEVKAILGDLTCPAYHHLGCDCSGCCSKGPHDTPMTLYS